MCGSIPVPTGSVMRDFPVPLISGGIAMLRVPFPMSEADFGQLSATLKAWKPALVISAMPQPDEVPRLEPPDFAS